MATTVETRIGCGRFLVRDDSGAALVDDDFLAVLAPPGASLPASGDAEVVIRHGDRIEVAGPVAWRAAPDLQQLGRGEGFRSAPRVLCFDGRPDALLLLRPLPASEGAREG